MACCRRALRWRFCHIRNVLMIPSISTYPEMPCKILPPAVSYKRRCGNVISHIDKRRSAFAFISGEMPNDEPIMKFTVLNPFRPHSLSFWTAFHLKAVCPQCILNIVCALDVQCSTFLSFASVFQRHNISPEGLSDNLDSFSSTISSLQNAPSRFEYSAAASRQYFSFSFPTVIRFILIKMPPPFRCPQALLYIRNIVAVALVFPSAPTAGVSACKGVLFSLT